MKKKRNNKEIVNQLLEDHVLLSGGWKFIRIKNMKTFTITFDNKNDMDATFDDLFKIFKSNNDFKSGNILICKTTKDSTNKIYMHVLDKAADAISDTIQRYINMEVSK